MPESKNPSVFVSIFHSKKEGRGELTSTHAIILKLTTVRRRRDGTVPHVRITPHETAPTVFAMQVPLSDNLHLASAARPRARRLATGRAQQLADLEQVQLHGVHEAGCLAVLGRRADRDRVVLDDVPDTVSIAGGRAETKVPQAWVPAVRGRQDRVVDLVPARVTEDGWGGWHRAHATEAEAVVREAIISLGKLGRVENRSVLHGAGVAVRAGIHAGVGRRRGELVKGALPQTVQRIQVAVLALGLGALLGDGRVLLGRFPESVNLLLRRVVTPEGLDKVHTLVGHWANSFSPSVQEELGHGRLVGALHTTIKTIVGSLKRHLEESIGREAHRSDEVLAKPFKIQHLKVMLLNQIGQARFGKTQSNAELGSHVPFELPRRGAHIAKTAGIPLGRVGAVGRPESWGLAVDRLGESEDGIGVDIADEPQHRVAIHTSVLEVDTSATVLAHDDLELVIPPVGASAHLHVPNDFASSADHVGAEFRGGLGFNAIQTEDEQCRVNNVQAVCVVGAFVPSHNVSHPRPHLAVFRAENAQGTLGSILNGSLLSVLNDHLEVQRDIFFSHNQVTVVVKNVEPVDLAPAQDGEMLRTRVLTDNTSILGRHTSSAEQSRVLVHAKRSTPNSVRGEFFPTDGTDEGQSRDNQGCRASYLVVPCGSRVIFQQEEGVQVQNNGYCSQYIITKSNLIVRYLTVVKVQVRVIPYRLLAHVQSVRAR